MDGRERRQPVGNDDSLLASVAGVPLTRMARIGLCLVWVGFWCVRVLLTDALLYIDRLELKAALSESLGDDPVDQAFSFGMMWLTVEIVVIVWSALKAGGKMLFAKTTPSLRQQVAETLTIEQLEAVLEKKRRKAQQGKGEKSNRKPG